MFVAHFVADRFWHYTAKTFFCSAEKGILPMVQLCSHLCSEKEKAELLLYARVHSDLVILV